MLLDSIYQKYNITDNSYGTRYDYGDRVYVENYSLYLVDVKDDIVSVQCMFYNGFPDWFLISPYGDSLHYALEPPKGSVEDLRNIFERYVSFAQKYRIATLNMSLALDLFSQAPKNLPVSELSPVKVYSGDMVLYISQKSFGFGHIVDGVEVINKSMGDIFHK